MKITQFARPETINKAINTVRFQSFNPIINIGGNVFYKNKSEWVDECSRIQSILNDVMIDVLNRDMKSLENRVFKVKAKYESCHT